MPQKSTPTLAEVNLPHASHSMSALDFVYMVKSVSAYGSVEVAANLTVNGEKPCEFGAFLAYKGDY